MIRPDVTLSLRSTASADPGGEDAPTPPAAGPTEEDRATPAIVQANTNHSDCDQALYEVTFRNREIAVNGFRLSRPNFNSENDLVFEHVFANPNRRIDLGEIESVIGRPLTKKLREVVRDLGFIGELCDMFFPGVSKTAIEFVNPVRGSDFEARKLRSPRLETRR